MDCQSLDPQRNNRIDPQGATCWNIARDKCQGSESYSNDHERHRIRRRDPPQESLNDSCDYERCRYTETKAHGDEQQSVPKNKPENVRGRRAQRNANSDFISALHNGVRHDAEDSNHAQKGRNRSEHREQRSGLPKILKLGARVFLHSPHTRNCRSWIDFANSRLHCSDWWGAAGSDNERLHQDLTSDVEIHPPRQLVLGHIHLRLRRDVVAVLENVAGDSDDFPWLIVEKIQLDSSSDRIVVWEELTSEG